MTSRFSRLPHAAQAIREGLAGRTGSPKLHGWLRVLAACLLLLQPTLMSAVTPVTTRVITLQVLDSNNGRPVNPDSVVVECRSGLDNCATFHVTSDSSSSARGELRVEVPMQATALIINSAGSRIQQCTSFDDTAAVVPVSSIETKGLVAANECHTLPLHKLRELAAQPGRLVVFVHHRGTCKRQLPFC